MRVSLPGGKAKTVAKKRRIREPETLFDRDIAFFCDQCQGVRVPHIALKWRVTRGYVYRRLKRIPDPVKAYLRKRVSALIEDGIFCGLNDQDRVKVHQLSKIQRAAG